MNRQRKLTKIQPWEMDVNQQSPNSADFACIGIGEDMEPERLLSLAVDSGLNHVCQKNGHMFDQEVASSHCIIEAPENYLEFPIATIFTPQDLSHPSERLLIAVEEHFDSSSQKQRVLDSVVKAMVTKGLSQTLIEDVNSVADEFFTNAIYNAPFVDLVTHRNPGVSRHSAEIKLNGGKFARIFLAHDESRLVIGCEDPYGSLNLPSYLGKIKKTYQMGPAATINFGAGGAGGAGIGSYIIFNAGASLYFGVWPGRATILSCVIPLGMSNRRRIQLPKHFHWIQR